MPCTSSIQPNYNLGATAGRRVPGCSSPQARLRAAISAQRDIQRSCAAPSSQQQDWFCLSGVERCLQPSTMKGICRSARRALSPRQHCIGLQLNRAELQDDSQQDTLSFFAVSLCTGQLTLFTQKTCTAELRKGQPMISCFDWGRAESVSSGSNWPGPQQVCRWSCHPTDTHQQVSPRLLHSGICLSWSTSPSYQADACVAAQSMPRLTSRTAARPCRYAADQQCC